MRRLALAPFHDTLSWISWLLLVHTQNIMADAKDYADAEKGAGPQIDESYRDSEHPRQASVVAASLIDDRFGITKRGLKSRHAQMIALGGTIGTG